MSNNTRSGSSSLAFATTSDPSDHSPTTSMSGSAANIVRTACLHCSNSSTIKIRTDLNGQSHKKSVAQNRATERTEKNNAQIVLPVENAPYLSIHRCSSAIFSAKISATAWQSSACASPQSFQRTDHNSSPAFRKKPLPMPVTQ